MPLRQRQPATHAARRVATIPVESLERRVLLTHEPGPGVPSPPDPGWTTGLKSLLYIRVTFSDKADREPQTIDSARRSMAFADAFFRANSYGQTAIRATFTPTIVLPHPESYYGTGDFLRLRSDALAAARAMRPAWDPRVFDLDVVRYNGGPAPNNGHSAGFAGTATRGAWLRTDDPNVAVHELGHNLGLGHANLWNPSDPDAPAGHGTNFEYASPFNMMGVGGGAGGHFNAWEKHFLGWLPDSNVEDVAESGTYTLWPADAGALRDGAVNALKVRKDDTRDFWISHRASAQWDGLASAAGLEVNWNAWSTDRDANSNQGSHLLDMTPGVPADRSDFALPPGRTFSDFKAGVHVTPLRRHADGSMDVHVALDADQEEPNESAPAAPSIVVRGGGTPVPDALFPVPTLTIAPGSLVTLTATSADADGDALAYAWDFGKPAAGPGGAMGQLSAGKQTTPTARTSYAAPGLYRVRVTVSDLRGRSASSSMLVRVTGGPGSAAPQAASGRVLDASGRPMHNIRVGDATRFAYTDSDGTYTLTGLDAAPRTIVASSPGGWTFAPVGFANPLEPGPATAGIDFRATRREFPLTGTVTTPNGFGVPDVLVFDGTRTVRTDALGRYRLTVPDGVYDVQFFKPGHRIPTAHGVVIEGRGAHADAWTDVRWITGSILGVRRDAGVRVFVTDGVRTTEAVFDFEGPGDPYYILEEVPQATWTLTATGVRPDGSVVHFAPLGWENPLDVDGAQSRVDFIVTGTGTFSVSGRLTDEGVGIDRAVVTAYDRRNRNAVAGTAITDANGRYALPLLSPSTYALAATKPGVQMASAVKVIELTRDTVVHFQTLDVPNLAPVMVVPASAEVSILRGVATRLSAVATDDDFDGLLTYTWRLVNSPGGGRVAFSRNGDNAAQQTTATFTRPGVYEIESVVRDLEGGRTTSTTRVVVAATPTGVTVDPPFRVFTPGTAGQFTATVFDQFGQVIPNAALTWTAAGDAGTLAPGGTFTAGAAMARRGSVVATLALPGGKTLSGSATVDVKPASSVAARHVFYNNSGWDGFNAAANIDDDLAIPPDKRVLLPGDGRAGAANYCGFSGGINGVLIDFAGLWGRSLSADDFRFEVGRGAGQTGWSPAPAPRAVAVRKVGAGGTSLDRVTLTWPDGAIRNTWLRVTVLPTQRTGLGAPDVFYFGNLVGDTSDAAAGAATARVSTSDYTRTIKAFDQFSTITSPFDHDHDLAVTSLDVLAARRNLGAWIDLISGTGEV